MLNPELAEALDSFTKQVIDLPDSDLDCAWEWNGHEEGIRFAFFVILRDLREAAVKLASKQPLTSAQRILGQYHAAYLDLQAVATGLSDEDAEIQPAENKWCVRETYSHILGAEHGFRAIIRYALDNHRAGTWKPEPIPESEYPRLYAIREDAYHALLKSPLSNMRSAHHELHMSILNEFKTIAESELDLPAVFWEPVNFAIRYRLHRFEAHFRQHTIQIEKTLGPIGKLPSESRRLLRQINAALADTDTFLIPHPQKFSGDCAAIAAQINVIKSQIA